MRELLQSIVVFLFLSVNFNSQNQGIPVFPNECESSVAVLDGVAGRIKTDRNDANDAPSLILIAGSPKGVSQVYDRQRINAVLDYYFHNLGISKDKIVWGIGENSTIPWGSGANSKKLSYLRFYIPGQTVYEIRTPVRGRVCTSAEQVP